MAELVSVGYGLIQNLKERGIKYIFGVPDGHSMELYDALLRTEGIDQQQQQRESPQANAEKHIQEGPLRR